MEKVNLTKRKYHTVFLDQNIRKMVGDKRMKWIDLIGKRLVGFMQLKDGDTDNDEDVLLFLVKDEPKYLIADCRNEDYSYYDNWRLRVYKGKLPTLNDTYKSIGSKVLGVTVKGVEEDDGRIVADYNDWVKTVGEGSWGPKEGEPYYFITITTETKTVKLGATYWDCHYPETIWDFI